MTNYLNNPLPGAGYVEITAVLDLEPKATVGEVLQAIERLKHKPGKPRKARKEEKDRVKPIQ